MDLVILTYCSPLSILNLSILRLSTLFFSHQKKRDSIQNFRNGCSHFLALILFASLRLSLFSVVSALCDRIFSLFSLSLSLDPFPSSVLVFSSSLSFVLFFYLTLFFLFFFSSPFFFTHTLSFLSSAFAPPPLPLSLRGCCSPPIDRRVSLSVPPPHSSLPLFSSLSLRLVRLNHCPLLSWRVSIPWPCPTWPVPYRSAISKVWTISAPSRVWIFLINPPILIRRRLSGTFFPPSFNEGNIVLRPWGDQWR